ncbi:MAG: hypothetical protein WED04_03265 [Promethearchaeati archaeon SRVP18_Atabeyarchaeia-1]
MSTVALLSLILVVLPQVAITGTSAQSGYDPLQELSGVLLNMWIIDMIAISVSVDHIALVVSIIPFLFIFPTALVISMLDTEIFVRILMLGILTVGFAVARYIANSI